MVERDIRLAEMTGGRLHLAKISTAEAGRGDRRRQGARAEDHLRYRRRPTSR